MRKFKSGPNWKHLQTLNKMWHKQCQKFVSETVENIVGKRRKCWLPAFSPFPSMFLKALCLRVSKTYEVKG